MKDYQCPIITEKINDKILTIVGVYHTHKFFIDYKDFFQKLVDKNDALVLEQSATGEFYTYENFFNDVANLAKPQKKKVYNVDPVTMKNVMLDDAALISGIVLITSALNPNDSYNCKTTRRKFLEKAGQITKLAVGTSLFGGSLRMVGLRGKDAVFNYGIDDLLLYGSTDYRNIVVAEGLERLCKELDDVKNLVAIHGAAHSKTVHEYFMHPKKRLKRLAYFPHDWVGRTKIREYTPDEEGWKLSRVF